MVAPLNLASCVAQNKLDRDMCKSGVVDGGSLGGAGEGEDIPCVVGSLGE